MASDHLFHLCAHGTMLGTLETPSKYWLKTDVPWHSHTAGGGVFEATEEHKCPA